MTIATSIIAAPKVDLPHHRIHEGNHVMVNIVSTGLLVASPKYVLIITSPVAVIIPNTEIEHFIYSISTNPGATTEFFEDAIVSANGTHVPIILNNRNSPTIPGELIFEDPIVVSEGTRLFIDRIGSVTTGGTNGPIERDEDEIDLKIGTQYLIKVTPLVDGTDITIKLRIYDTTQTPTGF